VIGRASVKTYEISLTNKLAHTAGRVGLAVLGALSALFVTALVAKADVAGMNCIAALTASILYASVGFYIGIDIPALRSKFSTDHQDKPDAVLVLSSVGTLLAAVAALISIGIFVFDASPDARCDILVGLTWLTGITMQLAAGGLGRRFDFSSQRSRVSKASVSSMNRNIASPT
jgi:mannose/fructose/N-acetylgalactosamine-specific phosphotransferase system component IID